MTARWTTYVELCPRLSQIESLEIGYSFDRSRLGTPAWSCRWILHLLQISRNVVSLSLHMCPLRHFLHFETVSRETWCGPGFVKPVLKCFETCLRAHVNAPNRFHVAMWKGPLCCFGLLCHHAKNTGWTNAQVLVVYSNINISEYTLQLWTVLLLYVCSAETYFFL